MSVSETRKKGKVYLVGAGPGDPSLVTLKGMRILQKADLVLYDYLANEALLFHVPSTAICEFVGKKGRTPPVTQEEIENKMITAARKGKIVVRLKGGDPFIFGRGGEEAVSLARAGIAFEVVPGVSSTIGVPAYAGIPLSHRDITSEIALVTGHQEMRAVQSMENVASDEHDTQEGERIHWDALAKIGTLVFLMSSQNLRWISQRLIAFGRSRDTPAAIVCWGTYPLQKTLVGTLATIAELAEEERILPPAILVIGEVVSFRDELNWFETKPLFGKKIVVTRTQGHSSEIRRTLEEAGAQVLEFPTIMIVSPSSTRALDIAIKKLSTYDWIFFTSAHGVDLFWKRLFEVGGDSRRLSGLKVGAIGPQTAERITSYGIRVDLLPSTYRAEGIVDELDRFRIKKKKVLIPRAKEAREVLPAELKKRGCSVTIAEVYRTTLPRHDPGVLREILQGKRADWIIFASSQTVRNFVAIARKEELADAIKGMRAACIGPITAKTASQLGFDVAVVPEEASIEALVRAIISFQSGTGVPQEAI